MDYWKFEGNWYNTQHEMLKFEATIFAIKNIKFMAILKNKYRQ